MDIQEMLNLSVADNGKVDVTPKQLKQLELFVVAYMGAAQLGINNKEFSDSVIKGLDDKWDLLFNIT